MEFNKVILDTVGQVAVLKFNHPEVMNAIGGDMIEGIEDALSEVEDPNNGFRCLMITGEGRGFCAGANLADRANRGRRAARGGLRNAYHPIFFRLRDLDMPIVTAVNGAAAGVGMSFALMGDIVCASSKAFFLQAFAKVGLIPDGGATYLLPRLIGWGRAMELSLLAERLPADKAEDWGLINRVYETNDELADGAMGIATQLANGPASLSLMRKAYWSTWNNAYEQQLDLEAQLQSAAGRTRDNAEGVKAFLEKRDAKFEGK